jgi:hypothetical protein
MFKEPYFLPAAVYFQPNVTVLHLSPWPTTAVAAELLLGQRRPLAAADLPVAVPEIVARPVGMTSRGADGS